MSSSQRPAADATVAAVSEAVTGPLEDLGLDLEGAKQAYEMIVTAFAAAESWLAWARKPIGTGPYRVAELRPDVSLTLESHDAYWGGRPPLRRRRDASD